MDIFEGVPNNHQGRNRATYLALLSSNSYLYLALARYKTSIDYKRFPSTADPCRLTRLVALSSLSFRYLLLCAGGEGVRPHDDFRKSTTSIHQCGILQFQTTDFGADNALP